MDPTPNQTKNVEPVQPHENTMTIEIPALGRPFSLGMLYDCRADKLIPGITFWNHQALRENVASTPLENTSFDIIASDTVSEKSSALNISASIKASFLSGLIEVGGSARYINDTKTSKNQARVTLKYSRTTRFEQLSMDHLGIQNMTYHGVFDKGTATHVVTGILYGAQAFFIFDRELSESDIQGNLEIQGHFKVMIRKVPSFTTKGKGDLTMNDKDKAEVKKFSCKFHGDFALESNPVTYLDAIKVYTDLPKLLGERGEKAVPVKVWLYPLRKLDSKAARLVIDIREDLVYRTEKVIQQMIDVKIQCNDLMRHPAAEKFPDIKNTITEFREQCDQFTLTFKKQLARTLPSIRGGGSEEAALADILLGIQKSPFDKLHITQFLIAIEQEMDTVSSYLEALPNIKVLPTEIERNKLILSPMTEHVVCFNFTSLNEEEPYLSDMCNWLQSPGHTVYENRNISPWFKDKDVSMRAKRCVRAFPEFAAANATSEKTRFIISSVPDQSSPGVSIYLYECVGLLSEKFEPPTKPNPLVISGRTHESMDLILSPADIGKEFIEGYKIEYRSAGTENWSHIITKHKDQKITVTGLKPNKNYQLRYSAVCKPGLSAASDVTKDERTLPTSPPEATREAAKPSYVILIVKKPTIIGHGATITEYKVEYKEKAEKQDGRWLEYRSGEFCIIEKLKPMTSYIIRVSAICGDSGVSAPSDEVVVTTTKERSFNLKNQKQENSILLKKKEKGKPSVYQLNMDLCDSGYRKYSLGKENLQKPNKVILLVGATGTGKTSLINGMANYILGVEWKDDFRFRLVDEATDTSEAHSQTSLVTAYNLHYEDGYEIPYSLTVIDTPGFGDTRGIAQDKKIIEDIAAFLTVDNGIDQIDAVCFVVQSSLARLTHIQKYICESVFSTFGKDIRDNIMILINFSDGEKPPVLQAIKVADIPYPVDSNGDPVHIKFNNSALFASNQASDMSFTEMFWMMGEQSMGTFFSYLTNIETKSLMLTKKVIKEWNRLQITVQALQSNIKAGLMILEVIRKTKEALQQNKDCMAANEDLEYEVTLPVLKVITGCSVTRTEKIIFKAHTQTVEKMSKQPYMEYNFVKGVVFDLNIMACKSLMRLHKIALRPTPLSDPEHIGLMIQSEEQEAKPGYHERIQSLMEVRQQAEILKKIDKGEELLH
ncbi:neoverrucotoxin subunit beta-like [Pseudophryne corroboree]|uniref:neoverrucotoxin subunit beta-like n=1 Tax=Pseudophryne corroboree TaxID=495146 RepID=UPI003081C09B